MAHWWEGLPAERYWCEITDRAGEGGRLECPRADAFGHPWWSFDFIRLVVPGDVVFHFSPALRRIAGASAAGGPCVEADVLWPAPPRDLFDTRDRGRVLLPGWTRPLRGFRAIGTPLTLEMIRSDLEREWHANWWELSRLPGYLPLHTMVFPRRPPSARGYLIKVPADMVGYWRPLADLAASVGSDVVAPGAHPGESSP